MSVLTVDGEIGSEIIRNFFSCSTEKREQYYQGNGDGDWPVVSQSYRTIEA